MAFQIPITIREAVHNINVKKYLLPAIQREVVWDVEQIQKLFDSLMREYPIGSFLFWSVEKLNLGTYQFYEFVRDYHQRDNPHNTKADVKGQNSIIGVLDGQQRLTSLYLGLLGSYAYKEPRKRWDNPQAFPKRLLHLNLLDQAPEDENGLLYDFRFLTTDEAKTKDENIYWFPVGEILAHSVSGLFLLQKSVSTRPRQSGSRAAPALLFSPPFPFRPRLGLDPSCERFTFCGNPTIGLPHFNLAVANSSF